MFNAIAKPFGVLLILLYELVTNYGLALILFALLIRLILTPFQMKSKRGQIQMARLQPKMKELEKKHAANKQQYQAEVAKLYKEEKINPASGCIWSILPLPIMLALYQAIIQPITIMMSVPKNLLEEGGTIFQKLTDLGFFELPAATSSHLQIAETRFISDNFDLFKNLHENLRQINFNFFGLDLGEKPQWNFLWSTDWSDVKVWLPGLMLFLIPVISGVAQFISSRISQKMNATPTPEGQGNSMKTMLLMMPLLSVWFGFAFPAALGLYWTAGSIFATIQDVWLTKRYTRIVDAEEVVKAEARRIRDAELEAKRLETERKKAENATERNRNTSKRRRQTTEKRDQIARATEYSKKNAPEQDENYEPSRVGHRRYARGRAYDPHRYDNAGGGYTDDVHDEPDEMSELPTSDSLEVNFDLPDVHVDDFVFDTDDGVVDELEDDEYEESEDDSAEDQ